jgi:hypothetical protein
MNKITIDFDDMIKVRELISRYFPDRKVMLEAWNDPVDSNLEVWMNIQEIDEFSENLMDNMDKLDDDVINLNLDDIKVNINFI